MRLSAASLGLFAAAITVASGVQINQNHESLTARLGDQVDLICSAETNVISCVFVNPEGSPITIRENVQYPDGIVPNLGDDGRKCGITINSLMEKHNGEWKCVLGVTPDGTYTNAEGEINVTVAVPPSSVSLRVADDSLGDKIAVSLKEGADNAVDVACVAKETRPKPEFVWYIGDTRLQDAEWSDSVENFDASSNKGDYVQTLVYHGAAMHNGHRIKCAVEHEGYTQAQKEQRDNEADKELDLYFKPTPKAKDLVFYLKEGESAEIRFPFEANPQPTSGVWTVTAPVAGTPEEGGAGQVEEQTVPVGAMNVGNNMRSTGFEPTDVSGEFVSTLTIDKLTSSMAGVRNRLQVTNDEGTTEYGFVIEVGEKPVAGGTGTLKTSTQEPLGSGPVVGIVIVVVIVLLLVFIAVILRAKGLLCFAAASTKNEALTEEKNALDSAEKGDADANANSPKKEAPVAAAEAEDKKSNGAHTPV